MAKQAGSTEAYLSDYRRRLTLRAGRYLDVAAAPPLDDLQVSLHLPPPSKTNATKLARLAALLGVAAIRDKVQAALADENKVRVAVVTFSTRVTFNARRYEDGPQSAPFGEMTPEMHAELIAGAQTYSPATQSWWDVACELQKQYPWLELRWERPPPRAELGNRKAVEENTALADAAIAYVRELHPSAKTWRGYVQNAKRSGIALLHAQGARELAEIAALATAGAEQSEWINIAQGLREQVEAATAEDAHPRPQQQQARTQFKALLDVRARGEAKHNKMLAAQQQSEALRAKGKPERNIADIVAGRMKVSASTVRRWLNRYSQI